LQHKGKKVWPEGIKERQGDTKKSELVTRGEWHPRAKEKHKKGKKENGGGVLKKLESAWQEKRRVNLAATKPRAGLVYVHWPEKRRNGHQKKGQEKKNFRAEEGVQRGQKT